MKSSFLLVALGASLGTTLVASTPLWAQDAAVAQIAPDKAPFDWQIRLVAGQKFRTTIDTVSKTAMPMPVMPGAPAQAPTLTDSDSIVHMVVDQNVLSSDEKGARIEMIYREWTQKFVIRQNGVPNEAIAKSLPDIGKNMVGARLSYTLSPRGKVSQVQGGDEYIERILKGTGGTESEQQREMMRSMRGQMRAMMSQEALEGTIGKAFGTLPAAPIAPGESWKISTDAPAVMGLKISDSGTRTFVGREGNLAVIGETSVIASDPDTKLNLPLPANAKGPAPTAKIAMSGTSRGETRVDEKTGLARSSRSSQKIHMTTSMENIDGKGGKMEMTMDMTNEVTSTTEFLAATANETAPEAPIAVE